MREGLAERLAWLQEGPGGARRGVLRVVCSGQGHRAPKHRAVCVRGVMAQWRERGSGSAGPTSSLSLATAPLLSFPARHSAGTALSQATQDGHPARPAARSRSSSPSALRDIRRLTTASFQKLFSLALATSHFPGFLPDLCPQAFSPELPTHMPDSQANARPKSGYFSPIPRLSPQFNICARSLDLTAA